MKGFLQNIMGKKLVRIILALFLFDISSNLAGVFLI